MTDEAKADDDSLDLGTAAELLFEDGKTQAAALLADAEYRTEYLDTAFTLPLDDSDPIVLVTGVITVPRFLVERFTEEIVSDVHGALSEASGGGISVQNVRIVGKVNRAGADWRESLMDRMAPTAAVTRPLRQPRVGGVPCPGSTIFRRGGRQQRVRRWRLAARSVIASLSSNLPLNLAFTTAGSRCNSVRTAANAARRRGC